ncbi:SMP-30/gluconolactonase/LRE family protein [Alphaproteobacteria bacterium]|nr:SMP-30/gluconolactonase/LRE family protein [Alphaproteobacteria bacterium]
MSNVNLLYKCNNILGEGITYSSDSDNLFWLDINNQSKLYKLNLGNDEREIFELPEIVTATSIKSQYEIILVSNNGISLFDLQTKRFIKKISIEDNIPKTRSNDGASDALGRMWFGTMQNNFDENGNDISINQNIGKLYKVDINKKITLVEEDLGIPNTFVWSPDNSKFYFTDTLNGKILHYDFHLETGELSNKKELFNFNRGHPDGSTIDTDGCIWNCRWGGSCVVRLTPTGEVDQIIEMPVENITNCVFGGKDMKTLFITTASNKGKNKNDLDGSLFSINLSYQGIEDNKSKLELS